MCKYEKKPCINCDYDLQSVVNSIHTDGKCAEWAVETFC